MRWGRSGGGWVCSTSLPRGRGGQTMIMTTLESLDVGRGYKSRNAASVRRWEQHMPLLLPSGHRHARHKYCKCVHMLHT